MIEEAEQVMRALKKYDPDLHEQVQNLEMLRFSSPEGSELSDLIKSELLCGGAKLNKHLLKMVEDIYTANLEDLILIKEVGYNYARRGSVLGKEPVLLSTIRVRLSRRRLERG